MANELRFAGDANTARQANFLARARRVLQLPADVLLELKSAEGTAAGGHRLEYDLTQSVKLEGREYGAANGVTVDEHGTASLQFDAQGNLISSGVDPLDQRHLQLVKDQVRKLAAADQIGAAPSALPGGKPWHVEIDAQGNKRLKRAYID